MVHVFTDEARKFYDLERLWSDAEEIDISKALDEMPKHQNWRSAKAKMLTQKQVSAFTGHAVGGVCPFANPEGVRTYLDISTTASRMRSMSLLLPAPAQVHPAQTAGVLLQLPAGQLDGGVGAARRGEDRVEPF